MAFLGCHYGQSSEVTFSNECVSSGDSSILSMFKIPRLLPPNIAIHCSAVEGRTRNCAVGFLPLIEMVSGER